MNPHARPRNTESTGDVLAYPPEELRATELFVYAFQNAAPTPGDVAAFGIGTLNAPNADPVIGSSTIGALIMFDTAAPQQQYPCTENHSVAVTVRGPAGSEAGVLMFRAGTYNEYYELRIVIGSGTAGKLFLRQMHNGGELWRFSEDLECSENGYDFPADTDIELRLCVTNRIYHADEGSTNLCGSLSTSISGRAVVGLESHEIGRGVSAGNYIAPAKAGMSIANGSGVTFDDFSFSQAGLPECASCPDLATCPTCPTCVLLSVGTGEQTSSSKFTVVLGSWVFPGSVVRVETSNSLITLDDSWVNDNLTFAIAAGAVITGTNPWTFRYVFSYVDTDNYWCAQWDRPSTDIKSTFKIIERSGASETVHLNQPAFYNGAGVMTEPSLVFLDVYDCTISLFNGYAADCISVTGGLNKTGQIGFASNTVTDYIQVSDAVSVTCNDVALDANCDTIIPDDNPGDPTGCCSELSALEAGDTVEATVTGASYWLGLGCDHPDCTITSDYLTDLNSTHVLRCIFKNDKLVLFYAQLGIPQPCERPCNLIDDGFITIVDGPEGQLVDMWIWIVNDGMGNCQIFGRLSTKCDRCATYFQSTGFVAPGACETFTLAYASGDGSPGNYNCCMQMSGSTIGLNFP